MKKIIPLVLSLVFMLSLAACGTGGGSDVNSSAQGSSAGPPQSTADSSDKKVLVAYFSATGSTKAAA